MAKKCTSVSPTQVTEAEATVPTVKELNTRIIHEMQDLMA